MDLPPRFHAITEARLALLLLGGQPPLIFEQHPDANERYLSVMREILPALEKHAELLHADLDRAALAEILTAMRHNCEGPVRERARIDFDAMDEDLRRLADLLAPSVADSPASRELQYPLDPPFWPSGLPQDRS